MMNVLYLTVEEQKIFNNLSSELKEGWSVETESQTYNDSPEKFAIRLRTYRPYDAALRVLALELGKTTDLESASTVLSNTDFTHISDNALLDLFYTLGPALLSSLILQMLLHVSTDEDLHSVAAFAVIRHSLLAALILRSS